MEKTIKVNPKFLLVYGDATESGPDRPLVRTEEYDEERLVRQAALVTAKNHDFVRMYRLNGYADCQVVDNLKVVWNK